MEGGKRISVSQTHRREVLRIIHESGALSRIDIAERMKLTKATVTLLTNEMLETGVLCERGIRPVEKQLSRGRRKILLNLNENYKLVFGAVLEKDNITLGLTNLKGQTLDKSRTSVEGKSYREVLETIVSQLEKLMQDNCLIADKILGLGVSISPRAGGFMEEVTRSDKAVRIRKDLAHALSFPIVSGATISGALLAQQLFSEQRPILQNILLVRYGAQIESAVLANGKEYVTANKTGGGFLTMQKRGENSDSYQDYLYDIEHSQQEAELTTALNQQLAENLSTCCVVLDPDKIYGFGDYLEQDDSILGISQCLQAQHGLKNKMERSVITEDTVYLSACAMGIHKFFYGR